MKTNALWKRARHLTAAAGMGMCVMGLSLPGYAESEAEAQAQSDTAEADAAAARSAGQESAEDTARDASLEKSDAEAQAQSDTAEANAAAARSAGQLSQQDTRHDRALEQGSSEAPPVAAAAPVQPHITLTPSEALGIGKRIWKNECAGTVDGLTSWNKGEGFASLGIGHFIWFPAGTSFPYQESFPSYLAFASAQGKALPSWLQGHSNPPCPWTTREAFMKDFKSPKMTELRSFLKDTVATQAMFAAQRMAGALPKMLESAPVNERDEIQKKFYAVASTPGGVYALMDYVNFKGEGTNPKERYKNQGWGLLQVLELMPGDGSQTGDAALAAFRKGAVAALSRRVDNATPAKQPQEKKWLAGWTNRINTYKN